MVCQTQQNMAFSYLFDYTTRENNSIDIALGYLPLKKTSKKLDEEKAQFDCFNGSCIKGFSITQYQGYGKT